MPTAERYEIAPVVLEHSTDQTLELNQLIGFNVSTNTQKARTRAGGSVDSLAWIVGRGKPTVNMTTRDAATALTAIPATSGLCIDKATFNVFERDVCNVWTGAGSSYVSNGGGLIYPDSMAASVDDSDGALLTLMYIPFWNGTEDPLLVTPVADTALVPAPAYNSSFFMGPLYVNGVELKGITSATLNFGLSVSATTETPGPYDRLAAVTDRAPTIQITGLKLDEITSLFYGQQTNTALYFQKGAQFGDRVPYLTAEHIKFTAAVSDIEHTDIGGDAPADATDQFTLRIVGPPSVSLASTIP